MAWNSSGHIGATNFGTLDANSTDIFSDQRLRSAAPDVPWSTLSTLLKDPFQSLYHLVRMELGVILENQIYASPDMYNKSISDVSVDLDRDGATMSCLSTTTAILMVEWRDSVRLLNETDRVPVMPYLRSVPQLKSLGSAITGVFVSKFAMLSVAWTIFSVITGALAASHTDTSGINEDEARLKPQAQDLEGQQPPVEEWDISEACLSVAEDKRVLVETLMQRLSTIEKNSAAVSEMQLSFAEMQLSFTAMQLSLAEIQRSLVRMRRSLRKHGILEEIDGDIRIEGEHDVRGALHIWYSY
ncbi:hypothetical protein B0H17DRAFT_1236265 [Mycena rosella]|uniref:Uncharacterized protein n=1 Tax=Mycena rosella TaxID=1033263 RepID=A0AAD7D3T9_MYCRO|nr:hypothetical protein B0H17DRAFT_1236265 [Mycena rosella]